MPKVNTSVPAQWHDLVTSVRTSTDGALYALGQYREEDGKGYRYVKNINVSAVAAVSGNTVMQASATDPYQVTTKDSERIAGLNSVMGVLVSVIPTSGFGWVQTRGICTNLNCGTPNAGDGLIESATDGRTGTVAANTAPTNKIVGWALTNAAANVCTAYLVMD